MYNIVGIGGTTTRWSSTECALRTALEAIDQGHMSVQLFDGEFLVRLPHYGSAAARDNSHGRELVAAIRDADGLIIASPGYHGSVSGLIKNALDYLEETARDARCYLNGVPVGLIVTAYGWQATGSTMAALRSIVHALRGWPTPFGAAIKSAPGLFSEGRCVDTETAAQLGTVGQQVAQFVLRHGSPRQEQSGEHAAHIAETAR